MTQEQKRIKIAEACGWRNIRVRCGALSGAPPRARKLWEPKCPTIPDYFSDLNACHEMEKVLTDEQYIKWAMLVNQAWLDANHGRAIMRSASATAAQRAEAFGRTLNLW